MRATASGLRILFQGNLRKLSSFSIINRQLIGGLRGCGHRVSVFPLDDPAPLSANPDAPDVYIFHGYPWEARSAPGRVNVFALNYEYLAPDRELRALVVRLNAAFDLVVVPSAFVKPVLAAAGLKVPVTVIPWGYDPTRFHPRTRPVALAKGKAFLFLYVGAVNQRKGVDLLLDAYRAEFRADDAVALVIKETFRHPTWDGWRNDIRTRSVGNGRRAAHAGPEIIWIEGESPSIAEYFAAADVGVFPHRGEGFGLPVLECIASGRRVIVTAGSGPAAFCSRRNAWQIDARPARRHGQLALEPDVRRLRALLRTAYARGTPTASERLAVSRTVRDWTWAHSVAALDAAIRRWAHRDGDGGQRREPRCRARAVIVPDRASSWNRRTPRSGSTGPAVAYAFYARGTDSWKKVCTEIDKSLTARFKTYHGFTYRDRFDLRAADIVVGASEHCLEVLLKARRRNPHAMAIVHQECTVLGDHVAIVNRERSRCGLPPIATRPIDLWRNRLENELADHFIVASSVARGFYLANGFDPGRIHIVPQGMHAGRFHFRGRTSTTRFLYLGTDPFRKGIRPLLAAWDRAALRNAELICFTTPDVLQSELLLKYLVRNPNISIRPLAGQRQFLAQYAHVDCQVLPSLEDSFSLAVADGMGVGKPAIVSTATGIQDLIVHGVNGHIVSAGDVDQLAASLQQFAADRTGLRAMGEAAYETARAFPWSRFRRSVAAVVESVWAERR